MIQVDNFFYLLKIILLKIINWLTQMMNKTIVIDW